jgi:hypothetical protein
MYSQIDLLSNRDRLKIIKDSEGKTYFFDPIRKKNIRVLPEEMVRQLVINHLIYDCDYPIKQIQVERTLIINGNKRRYDVIVFDRNQEPFLLVECKSYKVKINQKVFDQIALYNIPIKSPYLWVTNGELNMVSQLNESKNSFEFIECLPQYLI